MRNETSFSDHEILERLNHEPQSGMQLLLQQYTALVWHIISRHLKNPEDIRECTNDTFAEFYFQRERFDPKKADLKTYLSAIARNLAVSYYRKQKSELSLKEELCEISDDVLKNAELRMDIVQVMQELKPEEYKIIQMKYYGGMTLSEIAASLNLSYETVKKRHQRTMAKLRRLLIFLLILELFLLSALGVYASLRYFGVIPDIFHQETAEEPVLKEWTPPEPVRRQPPEIIVKEPEEAIAAPPPEEKPKEEKPKPPEFLFVPGVGLNEEPQAGFYELHEPVIKVLEAETVTLESASYLNQTLRLTLKSELDQTLSPENDSYFDSPFLEHLSRITVDGQQFAGGQVQWYEGTHIEHIDIVFEDITLPVGETVELMLHTVFYPEGNTLTFSLNRSEREEALEKHVWQMARYGGVLAEPRLEEGSLIVAIYPLNTDEMYRTLPALIYDSYGRCERNYLTVTDEQGKELTGACIRYRPRGPENYFEWNFGPAEPGTYTLHIPYLYQLVEAPADFKLPFNPLTGQFEDTDYPIPGGALRIGSCTLLEPDENGMYEDNVPASSNPDRVVSRVSVVGSSASAEHEFLNFYPEIAKEFLNWPVRDGGVNLHKYTEEPFRDQRSFQLEWNPKEIDPESVSFCFPDSIRKDAINYRWNQSFDLTFTVAPE